MCYNEKLLLLLLLKKPGSPCDVGMSESDKDKDVWIGEMGGGMHDINSLRHNLHNSLIFRIKK